MTLELPVEARHWIAGEWIASSGEGWTAYNPKTSDALPGTFRDAGESEVNAAFHAASSAFQASRALSSETWANLLDTLTTQIERRRDALIARAGLETALPQARLEGELARTTGQIALFARIVRDGSWVEALIDTAEPDRNPLPKPDIRRMARPIGPVVVFDASNFPFAFGACGGDTISAMAAGNPVIVKAHPGHPGTDALFAEAVGEALRETGLPAGLFALLQGMGTEIGAMLVQHPQAEAVGFTGSQTAGRALFDLAAARPRPIPVYAEMGSVNPMVLLPGALSERGDAIADGLSASATLGGGQFCTKPGIAFYVDDEAGTRFAERLGANFSTLPPATLLNAGIRDRFTQSVREMRNAPGVTTRAAGESAGYADVSPFLLQTDAPYWLANPRLHEEAFGPALLLVRCETGAELETALESLSGQLTGTVHAGAGDDSESVARIAAILEARVGRLLFNGYPTGVEVGYAMLHGGPYPATTAAGTTSVGASAIRRFARPVAFQNAPDNLLPPALQNANPLQIRRFVNGILTSDAL